jgi:hypothetical protein
LEARKLGGLKAIESSEAWKPGSQKAGKLKTIKRSQAGKLKSLEARRPGGWEAQ